MYKLVCVDVDGTLLNSKHKVTQGVIDALQAAHEKGVHIVISTGRMYASAAYYRDLLGLSSGIIASNGSYIATEDGESIVRPFSYEDARRILETCKQYGEGPLFYTPFTMYTGSVRIFLIFNFLVWRKIFVVNSRYKTHYLPLARTWYRLAKKHEDEVIRFEIINRKPGRIDVVKKAVEALGPFEIARSTPYNIEVTAQGVSKGSAVALIAEHYGIAREEVLCIGDSENDSTMLQYAGLGVAMGNAPDNVKAHADFVTATNDEDGVAKVIEQFILRADT